jgi:hypothetical protein
MHQVLPMGRKSSAVLTDFHRFLLAIFLAFGMVFSAAMAHAADLPLAAGSPLVGFTFDDRPLLLPVQQNFQMAMLTASSELGRSCGKMEAYGWRMKQSEQQRVDQIFNNTVDRMRGIGYEVESQSPTSISHDITIFTADRADKHFIFMWSAGEIGLVMVLCESTAPIGSTAHVGVHLPSVEVLPPERDVVASEISTPVQDKTHQEAASKFSPIGEWVGSYICAQGYTGGTLDIRHLNGENFDGEFRFYPTAKNPLVPKGGYTVYGQYDRESQRILINPGKWISRPQSYYNTIMVGSFDPVLHTFSAYFQGITGCTSFEAKETTPAKELLVRKAVHKKPKSPVKKVTAKKPSTTSASTSKSTTTSKTGLSSGAVTMPATSASTPAEGIVLPEQNAPPSMPAATPTPALPAPTAASPPASAPVSAPVSAAPIPTPNAAPSAPTPVAPTVVTPITQPPVTVTPASPPAVLSPASHPAAPPSGASFVPAPTVPAAAAASAPLAPSPPAVPTAPSVPSVSPPSMQPSMEPSMPAASPAPAPLPATSSVVPLSPTTTPAH